ncbi:MAG: hypothetical protein EOM21_13075 [Gammaproteobacteria bacterium]|nr:hypothetical protein [Gammaproteobacteria bacterium]
MRTYHEFPSLQEAAQYRQKAQTGGWIFAPDTGEQVWLFPWPMTPREIMQHPLTRGRSGQIVGQVHVPTVAQS